jgi:hypothetical protein
LPGGQVFIHVYEQSASVDPHEDYWADELIGLEMQRWASLAPIFDPDSQPELCYGGVCDTGVMTTTKFTITDIVNTTGQQPVFDYPQGKLVNYTKQHFWGDTNYGLCEGLWFLELSQGGEPPAAPACPQAYAAEGYPGTYRFEGVLGLNATWTSPIPYEYHWTLDIDFWVALRAPGPGQPPAVLELPSPYPWHLPSNPSAGRLPLDTPYLWPWSLPSAPSEEWLPSDAHHPWVWNLRSETGTETPPVQPSREMVRSPSPSHLPRRSLERAR